MPRSVALSRGSAPEVCGEDGSSRASSVNAACDADTENLRLFLEALRRLLGQDQALRQAEEQIRAVSSSNEVLREAIEDAEEQLSCARQRRRCSTFRELSRHDSREGSPTPRSALSPGSPINRARSLSDGAARAILLGEIEGLEAHNESLRRQIQNARDELLEFEELQPSEAHSEAERVPVSPATHAEIREAEAFYNQLSSLQRIRVQEEGVHRDRLQELWHRMLELEEQQARRREELIEAFHERKEECFVLKEQVESQRRGLRFRLVCLEEERHSILLGLDEERVRHMKAAISAQLGTASPSPHLSEADEAGPQPGLSEDRASVPCELASPGSSLFDEIDQSPDALKGGSPILVGSLFAAAKFGRKWRAQAQAKSRARESRASLVPFRQQGLLKFNSKGICQQRPTATSARPGALVAIPEGLQEAPAEDAGPDIVA